MTRINFPMKKRYVAVVVVLVVVALGWFSFNTRQVSPSWANVDPLRPGCPVGDTHGQPKEVFWSQMGQDKLIYDAFYSKPKPVCSKKFFLDVGANDGKIGSNSLFFESYLGWDVVSVEADSRMFQMLNANRPLSRNVWAAVSNKYAEQTWVADGVTEGGQSGIREGHSGFEKSGEMGSSLLVSSANTVVVMPLMDVIRRFQIKHIDVMSLDIEGAEANALSSLDFKEVTIDVITYECNTGVDCDPVRTILQKNEYLMWSKADLDEVWVKKGFHGVKEACDGTGCIRLNQP